MKRPPLAPAGRCTGSVHLKQSGITGLETAIILIAFVVVASVFSFTVLSVGIFSSERSKETIHEGVQETQSTLSPRGSVVALTGDIGGTTGVAKIVFSVSGTGDSGDRIDLTPPYTSDDTGTDPDASGLESKATISYTDNNQHKTDAEWTVEFVGGSNGDYILDDGETAEITVWLNQYTAGTDNYALGTDTNDFLATRLGVNDSFTIELDAGVGATVKLQRDIPARLLPVINLH